MFRNKVNNSLGEEEVTLISLAYIWKVVGSKILSSNYTNIQET